VFKTFSNPPDTFAGAADRKQEQNGGEGDRSAA
jgi:hypothetical protein